MNASDFMFLFQFVVLILACGLKMFNVMSMCTKIQEVSKQVMILLCAILAWGIGLVLSILSGANAVVEADTVYFQIFNFENIIFVLVWLFFFAELFFLLRKVAEKNQGIKALGT